MTPQQRHKREISHINCQLVIKPKATRRTGHQHMGLYCREHGIWFKWLGAQEFKQYQSLGVKVE